MPYIGHKNSPVIDYTFLKEKRDNIQTVFELLQKYLN